MEVVFDRVVLDKEYLKDYFFSDAALLDEVLFHFTKTEAETLQEMQASLALRDEQRLAKATHKLRGSLLIFTQSSLTESLERIEFQAKTQAQIIIDEVGLEMLKARVREMSLELRSLGQTWSH